MSLIEISASMLTEEGLSLLTDEQKNGALRLQCSKTSRSKKGEPKRLRPYSSYFGNDTLWDHTPERNWDGKYIPKLGDMVVYNGNLESHVGRTGEVIQLKRVNVEIMLDDNTPLWVKRGSLDLVKVNAIANWITTSKLESTIA